MVKLRLPWGSVKAATVSLVVLVAQWLPVSANGGDPLIDTLGSARSTLDKYGISLALQSTDEVFGNPNGGRAQGATFDGQSALGLGIDLDKAIDLKGGIFNVSAFQNYGHGISASNIDNPKNGNWHVRVWLRLVHFHGHDARSLRLWPSPVG